MWDLVSSLLLFAASLGGVAIGVGAIRDVSKGTTPSLSRMSTRVYLRSENPTAFWITIGVGVWWGLLGAFLLVVQLGWLLDYLDYVLHVP